MSVLTDTLVNFFKIFKFLLSKEIKFIEASILNCILLDLGNTWRSSRVSGQMRDAALALSGFTAGIFPSLQVSLTSPLGDFSQVFTQLHKSIRPTERELWHFIYKLRLDQGALDQEACCCHKRDLWVIAALNTLTTANIRVLQFFFCIHTLTSLPLPCVDSCHVLTSLDEINSFLHLHSILPAFSSLAET